MVRAGGFQAKTLRSWKGTTPIEIWLSILLVGGWTNPLAVRHRQSQIGSIFPRIRVKIKHLLHWDLLNLGGWNRFWNTSSPTKWGDFHAMPESPLLTTTILDQQNLSTFSLWHEFSIPFFQIQITARLSSCTPSSVVSKSHHHQSVRWRILPQLR